MYILIVSRGCPTKKYPLNALFEFDQARALAQAGQKVVFAAIDQRSIRRWRKWGIEHFINDGVEVYAINIPLGRVPYAIRKFAGSMGLRMLYRQIRRDHGEPDIVHAHFLKVAAIALTLRTKLKSAFVMTEHGVLLEIKTLEGLPSWFKKQALLTYHKYDKVICVSPAVQKRLEKFFNVRNMTIIYNMLDPLFFKARRINSARENFDFVFVGSLIDRKSPLECIHAFYDAFHNSDFVTPDGRRIRLHMIGGGSLFSDCQCLIKDLGLESCVFVKGQMTRDKIANILRTSDCFVLPSKSETFGVVYIEAMACGLPVIATKCGGPESFVNEKNGLLIEPNDRVALVNSFKYMLANAGSYDNEAIASWTKNNFSGDAIARQLIGLYKKLR